MGSTALSKWRALGAVLIALASAGAPSVLAYDATTKLKATAFATDAVKRKLRDPGSAEFRKLIAYEPGEGALVVCGEVNAKNGFGGYAGFEPFVWFPLGPDLKPDVRNGTALLGAGEIGDMLALCRNAR
jgi:hypothetical protein